MVATVVSFDGTERCSADVLEPANRDDLVRLLTDRDRVAIRGSGLSYCQAGAAEGTASLSTRG